MISLDTSTLRVDNVNSDQLIKYFDFIGDIFGRMNSAREAGVFRSLAEDYSAYLVRDAEGHIVGGGQAPLAIYRFNKDLDVTVACISALGTIRQARKRGVLRKLLGTITSEANPRGADYAMLFSDLTGLYEKFGFTPLQRFYSATVSNVGEFDLTSWATNISSLSTSFEVLHSIHENFVLKTHGAFRRSSDDWNRQFHQRAATADAPELKFVWIPDVGYIIYRVFEQTTVLSEIAIIRDDGWPALWNRVVSDSPNSTSVILRRVSDADPVLRILDRYEQTFATEYLDTLYAQPINIENLLRNISWKRNINLSVRIDSSNFEPVTYRIRSDASSVIRLERLPRLADAEVQVPAAALLRFAIGGESVSGTSDLSSKACCNTLRLASAIESLPKGPHISQLF